MSSEIITTMINFLERKNRPAIANLVFLVCGALEMVSFMSIISPFHISTNFFDEIIWKRMLDDDELIVNITLGVFILYGIICCIGKYVISLINEKRNFEIREIFAKAYAFSDVAELVCAIVSLLFIFSVLVQVYKSSVLFISNKACIIYVLIGFKACNFLFQCLKLKNLEIIDRVIKKYPELE